MDCVFVFSDVREPIVLCEPHSTVCREREVPCTTLLCIDAEI